MEVFDERTSIDGADLPSVGALAGDWIEEGLSGDVLPECDVTPPLLGIPGSTRNRELPGLGG
jgi:hypothetical protein